MISSRRKVAVIGGGSWATAIIKMLSDNSRNKDIYWWMRSKSQINDIKKYHRNPTYLSAIGLNLNPEFISDDVKFVIAQADIAILTVPAAFLKDALKGIKGSDFDRKIIVSAIKGIVPDSNQIIGDFLQSEYNVSIRDIAVISGPCHAEEVSQEKISYLTLASQTFESAELIASLLETNYIKTNISDDIYGTEYAAVLKNIYAIASGICHAVGFGDNFQAVLISSALREMAQFVDAVHPIKRDIKESAYLGDLLVTAYSQFSRNRTFGNMIGKGYTVNSAQLEMNMIAEGYFSTYSIYQIAEKLQIDIPICRSVYAVLYEKYSPITEMKKLAEILS